MFRIRSKRLRVLAANHVDTASLYNIEKLFMDDKAGLKEDMFNRDTIHLSKHGAHCFAKAIKNHLKFEVTATKHSNYSL